MQQVALGLCGGFFICPSCMVSPQRQMFYLLVLGLFHHSWVSVCILKGKLGTQIPQIEVLVYLFRY